METFREVLRLDIHHAYFGEAPAPVTVVPADPAPFSRAGLMMRQQGKAWLVIGEDGPLPDLLSLDVLATSPEVVQVTRGAKWQERAIVPAPLDQDDVTLDAHPATEALRRAPGQNVLCALRIELSDAPRVLRLNFDAVASHWAYHILGSGSAAAFVEDPDNAIQFDAAEPRTLPDGRVSHVLRSRQPLAARARPAQRFALKTPGHFGPRTLIPVLPAPGPDFVSIAVPGSGKTLVQSEIFVTIP